MGKINRTYGNVTKGQLSVIDHTQRANFYDGFGAWDDCPVEIIVREIEPVRSSRVLGYYWAVIVPITRFIINDAHGTWHDQQYIHDEYLCRECHYKEVRQPDGSLKREPLSTAGMESGPFREFVERCRRYLWDTHNCDTPDPDVMMRTRKKLKL